MLPLPVPQPSLMPIVAALQQNSAGAGSAARNKRRNGIHRPAHLQDASLGPALVFGTREETESALVRFSFMPTYLFEFHQGEPRITREAVELVSDAAARHYAVRRARDLPGDSVGDARQWIEVRDQEGRNLLRLSFSDAAGFGGIAPYP